MEKDGAVLPGKNNNVLIINDVQTTDEGSYTCVVTSLCGTPLTSGPGILRVLPATTITTQPSDATVCEGNNVSFSAGAGGSGLYINGRKMEQISPIPAGSAVVIPRTW